MAPLLDLHPRAGIDASLDAAALTLRFGPDVTVASMERRTADELRPVLIQPDTVQAEDLLYTLYRGVAPAPTAAEIAQRGLVFVALVLRPGTIGTELSRTRGHINSPAPGTQIAYPEVHGIWHGHGLLYLQNGAQGSSARDTVVVPLEAGDKAVVAPGWASLLVNVGDSPLVVGSWRSQDCILHHEALASLGGMAHYILPGATPGSVEFHPNPRYGSGFPEPRRAAPQDIVDFGLRKDEPMLITFRRNPDFLRFMLRPQDYANVWASLYAA